MTGILGVSGAGAHGGFGTFRTASAQCPDRYTVSEPAGKEGGHNGSTSTSFEQRSSTRVEDGSVRPRTRESFRRWGGPGIAGSKSTRLETHSVGRNSIRNSRSWRRLFSGFAGASGVAIVSLV